MSPHYRHFESKQDLQMKLLARRRDELAAAPLDAYLWWLEHSGTPPAVVVAAVLRVTQGVLATVRR